MNNEELLKDAYGEQMFERRANGLPTMTFEEWKEWNERKRRLIAELKKTPTK